MSKKISELPLYSGSAQPLGDVPISINGTTYRIDPILLINLSFKADLVDGKVPASQLPSYVDDIIEVANYAALPTTGEAGKIYVTLDNNHIFRWSGSAYIEITDNTAVWGAVTGNLTDQTDLVNALNARVPYTGATSNVDLGEWQMKAGQMEFDQTPTGTAGVAKLRWNDTDGTLEFGLKGGNVTLQIGQEQVVRVVNKTGSNILEANYQVVRVNGAQGQRPKIALAQGNNDANSADTIGLVTETINNNQEGFITVQGLVNGINTTGSLQGETWADGDMLYLSPTTAGKITNVKPSAPNHIILVGYLIYAHATQGKIYVNVQNGYELEELHNVAITSLADKQVLTYEYATSLWKNKSLGTIFGGTSLQFVKADGSLDSNVYAVDSGVVHLAGTETITGSKIFSSTPYLDNNIYLKQLSGWSNPTGYTVIGGRTDGFLLSSGVNKTALIGLGNLTQAWTYDFPNKSGVFAMTNDLHNAVTIGTANGLSLSTQVLSLGLASTSTNGALSSTDWNTFNGKQNALTNPVTGTGTSGYLPKFSGTSTIADSQILDNGTSLFIGGSGTSSYRFNLFSGSTLGGGSYAITNFSNTSDVLFLQHYGTGKLIKGSNFTNEVFNVSNSGAAYFADKVGIGTTSPSYKLHNVGDTFSTNYLMNRGGGLWNIIPSGGANELYFKEETGGNIRMTILGSGNVGIGTTSPARQLSLGGKAYNEIVLQSTSASGSAGGGTIYFGNTTNDVAGALNYDHSGNFINIFTNGSERMRITSGGNVQINTTSGTARLNIAQSGVEWATIYNHTNATTQYYSLFQYNGTSIGSITGSNTLTLYNTTSDYRLKEDFKDYNALDLVSNIKTYDFKFKNSEERMYGVIAHELQEVISYSVTGEKDANQMQGVDYSKLVPILIKSIQELKAEIEILKN